MLLKMIKNLSKLRKEQRIINIQVFNRIVDNFRVNSFVID